MDDPKHTYVLVYSELVNRTIVPHPPVSTMTLNELTNILEENPAVDDFSVKDDGVRFWVGVRAHKGAKQAVVDDIEALDGVEVTREKNENGWLWFYASVHS